MPVALEIDGLRRHKKMAGLPRGETTGTASAFEPAGGNRFERGSNKHIGLPSYGQAKTLLY